LRRLFSDIMLNKDKLASDLEILPDGMVIMLETSPDKTYEDSIALLDFFIERKDLGIIISASRPYMNLIRIYEQNNISLKKIFILDLVSKSQKSEKEADNVRYIENVSSLTKISLALNDCIEQFEGKKFVFIDSLTTMLIHNDSYVFARFIHSILTKLRIHEIDCIIISFETNKADDIKAEIMQLCDKVIKI